MKVILCLDDKNGMAFHQRRQSRDREVIKDIEMMCENELLWINGFSIGLFENTKITIQCDEDFLIKAGPGEYCMVEDQGIGDYEEKIEEVICYRWNRRYPADFSLDVDLSQWQCIGTEEWKGYSHDKITKERYKKVDKDENKEC